MCVLFTRRHQPRYDLILSRPSHLSNLLPWPLLCIVTGLNPTILTFLVVALHPTRPAEKPPHRNDSPQTDDTFGTMRDNITRVVERGERLDQLQDETGTFPLFLSND